MTAGDRFRFGRWAARARKAHLQVVTVRGHEFGDPEGGRRSLVSHFDIATSRPARPVGDGIPAQLLVEGADDLRRNGLPRKLVGGGEENRVSLLAGGVTEGGGVVGLADAVGTTKKSIAAIPQA